MATMKFQKNQHYQGQVADLNTQGAGVVKIDGFPFFVEGVIPGEEIAFKATKVKKNYGFGRLEKIITISPDRVELKDDLGRQIGTMTLQHMNYSSQLAYKQKVVKDAFQRLGHFDDIEVAPTLASDRQWQYRNKAQIPVRALKDQLQTGFSVRIVMTWLLSRTFIFKNPTSTERFYWFATCSANIRLVRIMKPIT